MPYKDIEKRREMIRNHYQNNKDYYQKKSNNWKKDNIEKVRESRIRYQKKMKLKRTLDLIIELKNEGKKYNKEANSFCYSIQEIIFESLNVDHLDQVSKSSFMEILDDFLKDKKNLSLKDKSNKVFYDKVYNPCLSHVKSKLNS